MIRQTGPSQFEQALSRHGLADLGHGWFLPPGSLACLINNTDSRVNHRLVVHPDDVHSLVNARAFLGTAPRHRAWGRGLCVALILVSGFAAVACDNSNSTFQRSFKGSTSCANRLRQAGGFPPHSKSPGWILTAGGLSRLQQAGLPAFLLRTDFNQPRTILLVSQGRPDLLAPRASLAFDFTSARALISALDHNLVPADVAYLLLDLERWPLTPLDEQRNPIGVLKEAISDAHARGKCVIFTPALDLVGAVDPGGSESSIQATFERLIVRQGAAVSDLFEIQAQHTEDSPLATRFAPELISVARAVSPREPVFVGLSTNPNGQHVSALDLLELYHASAAAGASGYWLNIPRSGAECPKCGMPQAHVAVKFLLALDAAPS
jgi:hypothetical protein